MELYPELMILALWEFLDCFRLHDFSKVGDLYRANRFYYYDT